MTLKTKLMLWLGSVFAAFTAAVLFVPQGAERGVWPAIILASAGFAFFAFSFSTVRWALLAVPGFVLTVAGLNYFRFHPNEPAGIAALVVTVAANALVAWARLRKHTDSHA